MGVHRPRLGEIIYLSNYHYAFFPYSTFLNFSWLFYFPIHKSNIYIQMKLLTNIVLRFATLSLKIVKISQAPHTEYVDPSIADFLPKISVKLWDILVKLGDFFFFWEITRESCQADMLILFSIIWNFII